MKKWFFILLMMVGMAVPGFSQNIVGIWKCISSVDIVEGQTINDYMKGQFLTVNADGTYVSTSDYMGNGIYVIQGNQFTAQNSKGFSFTATYSVSGNQLTMEGGSSNDVYFKYYFERVEEIDIVGTWKCISSVDIVEGQTINDYMKGSLLTVNADGTYTSTSEYMGNGTYSFQGNQFTAKNNLGAKFTATVSAYGNQLTLQGSSSYGVEFYYVFEKTGDNPPTPSIDPKRIIHVATAGTLSNYISEEEKYQIEELTLTGEINGTDFGFLREMAGKSMVCKNDNLYFPDTEGKLAVLDLSGVRILAGGNYYMIWDGIDNSFFYNLTNDNEIPPYIFNDCKKLTSIILPESINIIGQGAFSGTGWYNSQPDGMVYIGKVAYNYKGNMPPNTQIIIKDGTRSIACSAFGNQSNLTSVIIPNSVTYIGGINEEAGPCAHRGAFEGCSGLTSITMPSNLITIGRSTFFGCNNLASITIPGSVTAIGWSAFYSCSGLSNVVSEIANPFEISSSTFDDNTYSKADLIVPRGTKASYQSKEGWNRFKNIVEAGGGSSEEVRKFETGGITYMINDNGTTVSVTEGDIKYKGDISIPSSVSYNGKNYDVTSIAFHAFYCCEYLTSLIIPYGVTDIGNSTCSGCWQLNSVSIPNSVRSIGADAFSWCSSLRTVTIPNSVTSIGWTAFEGCIGLTSVISEIKDPFEIPDNVFENSSAETIATLTVPSGTKARYQAIKGWNRFKNIVEAGGGSPEEVRKFETGGITYNVNDNGTTVSVIAGNTKYEGSVSIPSSVSYNGKSYDVTSIGSGAFSDCKKLTSISIPNSVMYIQYIAFSSCSGLSTITLPNSIIFIGQNAFTGCSNLTKIYSEIEKPFELEYNSFDNSTLSNAILTVPAGTKSLYQSTGGWNMFQNVKETDEESGDVDNPYTDSPIVGKWIFLWSTPSSSIRMTRLEFKANGTFCYTSDNEPDYEEHGVFRIEGDLLYQKFSDEDDWELSRIRSVDSNYMKLIDLSDDGSEELGELYFLKDYVSGSNETLIGTWLGCSKYDSTNYYEEWVFNSDGTGSSTEWRDGSNRVSIEAFSYTVVDSSIIIDWGDGSPETYDYSISGVTLTLTRYEKSRNYYKQGMETRIRSIIIDKGDNQIYSLRGEKLKSPQKGINIIRGKKILVK